MNLLLADTLMVIHFLWAAFMVIGLPVGILSGSRVLRWVHFIGMSTTALIAAVNTYCPLTLWEDLLRWEGNPAARQGGNFLARHLSHILYPDVEPWFIRTATVIWGLATLLAMVLVPPGRKAFGKTPR